MPVLVDIAVLEVELGLSGHDVIGRMQRALAVSGKYQIDHGRADQFLRLIAQDAFAGSTDVNEATVAVHHAYSVQQQINKSCLKQVMLDIHRPTRCLRFKPQHSSLRH